MHIYKQHLHALLNTGVLQLIHQKVGQAEVIRIGPDKYEINLYEDGRLILSRRANFKEVERTLQVWFDLLPEPTGFRRRKSDRNEQALGNAPVTEIQT